MRIGIIGLGKMGEAIARGLQRSLRSGNPRNGGRSRRSSEVLAIESFSGEDLSVEATTASDESAREAASNFGKTGEFSFTCHTDNRRLVSRSDVILLCVKPHHAEKVLKEIADRLTPGHLLISICASITTEQLAAWSGGRCRVIRAMPNTPCLIGEGMTVLSGGEGVAAAQLAIGERIFSALGKTAIVEESLMDGVTGLSGCGPAYVYLMIEALSEAGVKVGLPRKLATLLASQTLAGAARMVIERGEHPASLKDEVTTPAGCTVDGLMALEEGKLRVTLIKAVLAATKRSKALRGKSG